MEIDQNTYKWGVDEYITFLVFEPIMEARSKRTSINLEDKEKIALYAYESAWNTIQILLLDKIMKSNENEKSDLEKYKSEIDSLFIECDDLIMPSTTPNINQRAQEDKIRMINLNAALKRIDGLLMVAIRNSGLWMRKSLSVAPNQAIKEKFL